MFVRAFGELPRTGTTLTPEKRTRQRSRECSEERRVATNPTSLVRTISRRQFSSTDEGPVSGKLVLVSRTTRLYTAAINRRLYRTTCQSPTVYLQRTFPSPGPSEGDTTNARIVPSSCRRPLRFPAAAIFCLRTGPQTHSCACAVSEDNSCRSRRV